MKSGGDEGIRTLDTLLRYTFIILENHKKP